MSVLLFKIELTWDTGEKTYMELPYKAYGRFLNEIPNEYPHITQVKVIGMEEV